MEQEDSSSVRELHVIERWDHDVADVKYFLAVSDEVLVARGSISILGEGHDFSTVVCQLQEERISFHQKYGYRAASLCNAGISFFSINGEIVSGEGLVARDLSGTSDPYVKVKLRSKCIYKTKIIYRTLDPEWGENFHIAVDNVDVDLIFKVYDFDRLSHDDDMGEAKVALGSLEVNKENEIKLQLINKHGFEEDLGELRVRLTIVPKTPTEKIELAQMLNTKYVKHGSKGQIWDSMLSVILIQGKNMKPVTPTGFCDPYVRFKLGTEKYKSKVSKQTLSPVWNEQFDLKLLLNNNPPPMEISVWDKDPGKDAFIGRGKIELKDLEPETSHYVELGLEDQPGVICMRITMTGLCAPGCRSDLNCFVDDQERFDEKEEEYSLQKTLNNFKQIGWMQVKLHRAIGLASADLGGASDPFAVIELNNQRLVTPTIYKTLNPQWDKIYEFMVYDIHDVLEITVFDEDKHGAPEFLGRIQIPLLSISSGEKSAYQLKDKRLQALSKGHLLTTIKLHYNPVRAGLRTFNPREPKVLEEVPRFRRQLLQENVNRLSNIIQSIIATGEFIQSLFTWKYKLRSAFAFMIYVLLVLNFDWFMLPLILFLVLLKNYIVVMLSPNKYNDDDETDEIEDEDDDDNDEKSGKKGKSKTFREKWEAINNICTLVQNHMDNIASFGERIKNTFTWTVPFLSYLLMVIFLLATLVLYLVPLRYLLLAWGVNKFTKRIRKPNAVPNNELLDFLSRVPSDPQIRQRRQMVPR